MTFGLCVDTSPTTNRQLSIPSVIFCNVLSFKDALVDSNQCAANRVSRPYHDIKNVVVLWFEWHCRKDCRPSDDLGLRQSDAETRSSPVSEELDKAGRIDDVLIFARDRSGGRVRKNDDNWYPGQQLVVAHLVGGPAGILMRAFDLQRDALILRQPHKEVELEASDPYILVELEACPDEQLLDVRLEVLCSHRQSPALEL